MFYPDDTIVAIATPPGRGGIGVVRLSGPQARSIAQRMIAHAAPHEARHATFTTVRLKADTTAVVEPTVVVSGFSRTDIDQVLAIFFPAPHPTQATMSSRSARTAAR